MLQSDKTTPIKSDYLLCAGLPLTDITPIFKITLVEIVLATFSNGILKTGAMIKVGKVCGLLALRTLVLETISVEVTVATMDGYRSNRYLH